MSPTISLSVEENLRWVGVLFGEKEREKKNASKKPFLCVAGCLALRSLSLSLSNLLSLGSAKTAQVGGLNQWVWDLKSKMGNPSFFLCMLDLPKSLKERVFKFEDIENYNKKKKEKRKRLSTICTQRERKKEKKDERENVKGK